MKTIYIVRHGESKANTEGIVAGSKLDSPLTEHGIEEAQEVAKVFTNKKIELIISSPLSRAKDTAKIIAGTVGYDPNNIMIMDEFNERDDGSMTYKTLKEYYPYEGKKVIPGAETEQEMFDRIKLGLEKLKTLPQKTILIVGHNGTYRMLRCVLENRKPNDFAIILSLKNSEYYKFELE